MVTPPQFARILHFLGLNVNNEDLKLILNKFQDPASGDVNYPAFVQAVDRGEYNNSLNRRFLSSDRLPLNTYNGTFQVKKVYW